MSKPVFTKAHLDAHTEVQRKLKWLPDGASNDEVISALRSLADDLQEQVTRMKRRISAAATRSIDEVES